MKRIQVSLVQKDWKRKSRLELNSRESLVQVRKEGSMTGIAVSGSSVYLKHQSYCSERGRAVRTVYMVRLF